MMFTILPDRTTVITAVIHSGHLATPPELAMLTTISAKLKYVNQSTETLEPPSWTNQSLYPEIKRPSDLEIV